MGEELEREVFIEEFGKTKECSCSRTFSRRRILPANRPRLFLSVIFLLEVSQMNGSSRSMIYLTLFAFYEAPKLILMGKKKKKN